MHKDKDMEVTFVMVKPDGVQRRLVGTIIERFENKGLQLLGLKYLHAPQDQIEAMYYLEKDASYFPLLLQIMTSGPVVPMVWQGIEAVSVGRKIMSDLPTDSALPGTIRGDFCVHVGRNACHAADTSDEARLDLSIWFPELCDKYN